jgi:membrane fusion protein, copper/silver efflux system
MKYILAFSIIFIFGACKTKKKDAVQKNQYQVEDGLMLSDQQVQLGNIHVDTIGKSKIGNTNVLNATLTIDETKSTAVSSRVAGRIDKLYFKNAGEYLKKGDKLYDLYSESLNNAKQEYILALEKERVLDHSIIDFKQLVESSKNKLLLWGMSNDQIALLSKTKQASPLTTFYSTASGTITEFESHEGEYISEGGTILRLADLSSLWAEAQVYSSQLSRIDAKGTVLVQIPDLGKNISGRIELVNPEINPDTRINLIRIVISNKGAELKPGMSAYVTIKNRENNALTIPVDAIIRNEKNSLVWLQTGKNTYKSVFVETGQESKDQIEIRTGLKAGDIIVTSGAYLINSEYIFKKGTKPGHKTSEM